MGGHGGINILHQKKWHVYNADNRAIVQRDEENHERKERAKSRVTQNMALSRTLKKLGNVRSSDDDRIERQNRDFKDDLKVVHKPLDDADHYERLLKKKLRGDEAGTRNFADVERYQRERGGASDRWLDKGAQKTYDRDHDKNKFDDGKDDPQEDHSSKDGHINFFEDVERSRVKREREHEQYLKDIGHDGKKDTCTFTDAQSKQDSAWYLKKSDERRNIASFQRRGCRPLSDDKDVYRKSKKYWLNKEAEEAERLREKKIQETVNRVNKNIFPSTSSPSFGGLPLGTLTIAETDEQYDEFEKAKEAALKSERDNTYDSRNQKLSTPASRFIRHGQGNKDSASGNGHRGSGMLAFGSNNEEDKPRSRRWRDRDELKSDTVVVATGSNSAPIGKPIGKPLPVSPEGHSGWIDDTPERHGPKTTTEVEWPRLLPKDANYMDKGKYKPKLAKNRRDYLESSSDD